MPDKGSLSIYIKPNPADSARISWAKAYLRFLLSRHESLLLKVAPLALLGLLPFDVVSNIVPAVGEMDDFGFIIALAVIASRTLLRMRRYR